MPFQLNNVLGHVYKLAGLSRLNQFGTPQFIPLTLVMSDDAEVTASTLVTLAYADDKGSIQYVQVMFGSLLAYTSSVEETASKQAGPSLLLG